MKGIITNIDYEKCIVTIKSNVSEEPYRFDVEYKTNKGYMSTGLQWIIDKDTNETLREVGEEVVFFYDENPDYKEKILKVCKLPEGKDNAKPQNFRAPSETINDIRCSVICALGSKLIKIAEKLEKGDEETYAKEIEKFKKTVDTLTKDLK